MNVRAAICLCAVLLCSVTLAPAVALAQGRPGSSEPTGDRAFARFIALIRGHLLTGDELVQRRQWNTAYPHFAFPTEEIYGVIRDELGAYGTPPFDVSLKALARTVRTRSATQYPKALEKVEAALAAADASLKSRQQDWPRFNVMVAVEVLRTAAEEYEDAVVNGRIVHPIGYRTARGFVLQAGRMIEASAADLTVGNAAALDDVRAGLSRLADIFAAIDPPKNSAMDSATVSDIVAQVATAAGNIKPRTKS
jgi:hypothetical protein